MKDNIGNEINIGDSVFCYSGQFKNTIQIVRGFRIVHEILYDREAVNLSNGFWLSDYNVVSLNALGVNIDSLNLTKTTTMCDAIGNHLNIGDKVLYLHSKEMYAEIGIIKSMSNKSCLLEIQKNRFGQTEYRKKYEELISLTALGISTIHKRNWRGEIID